MEVIGNLDKNRFSSDGVTVWLGCSGGFFQWELLRHIYLLGGG